MRSNARAQPRPGARTPHRCGKKRPRGPHGSHAPKTPRTGSPPRASARCVPAPSSPPSAAPSVPLQYTAPATKTPAALATHISPRRDASTQHSPCAACWQRAQHPRAMRFQTRTDGPSAPKHVTTCESVRPRFEPKKLPKRRPRLQREPCAASLSARPERLVHRVLATPTPSRSFHRIADGLHVASLELAFLQMARELDFLNLARLGFELCGSYSLDARAERGFFDRAPLTDPRKIRSFAEASPHLKRRKAVLRALQHVLPGSASPAETRLAMLLSLPCRLGGFGLPKPLMTSASIYRSPKRPSAGSASSNATSTGPSSAWESSTTATRCTPGPTG